MANLIDKTFFYGELNIPTNNDGVEDNLNSFIAKYETKFLRGILGRDLFMAFRAGLLAAPQEQRMLDILFGKGDWDGLITSMEGVALSLGVANRKAVIVNRCEEFDPTNDLSVVTIPPEFVGVPFTFSERGVGQLREDEFSVEGDQLTLIGAKFRTGDTYFYEKDLSFLFNASTTTLRSIIANYVYFQWINDRESQNVGIAVVKTKAENATVISGLPRACSAMFECRVAVEEFFTWMRKNSNAYPEFDKKGSYKFFCDYIKGINSMNI